MSRDMSGTDDPNRVADEDYRPMDSHYERLERDESLADERMEQDWYDRRYGNQAPFDLKAECLQIHNAFLALNGIEPITETKKEDPCNPQS